MKLTGRIGIGDSEVEIPAGYVPLLLEFNGEPIGMCQVKQAGKFLEVEAAMYETDLDFAGFGFTYGGSVSGDSLKLNVIGACPMNSICTDSTEIQEKTE